MSTTAFHGPAWDLSTEYSSADDPAIAKDIATLGKCLDEIEALNAKLATDARISAAQAIFELSQRASVLLQNVSTFARCLLSVDSSDEAAQMLVGALKNQTKRYQELYEPSSQFLIRAAEDEITAYLDDPRTASSAFSVEHARHLSDELLPLAEENLVSALSQDGIHAWGSLYGQLSGTLKCQVLRGNQEEEMGIAQAAGLMSSRSPTDRKAAWSAINGAWEAHDETCAASLNAIAGWRLEMVRKRSHSVPKHFLDAPAHGSRISRTTLDSLMSVADKSRALAQRAAKLQARAYGDATIGPWDQRAPAPAVASSSTGESIAFADALDLVANAYHQVDPAMGQFVRDMGANRWIEGTVGPNKRPGAYCTQFTKSRTPRVYMTYNGAAAGVITLAHELGHAYHNWVMRDLPLAQCSYGMSLAETASTFAETLVRDTLLAQATDPAAKLDIIWEELSALVAFVLNIPTRFTFEKAFYERRAERPLRPAEIKQLMSEQWQYWYGDSLTEPDPMFWASKLHFFISGLSFYNFPYLFGYLFSNGIYATRTELGDDFFPRFNALLRDTGRMRAEDLARKHLGVNLEGEAFWLHSIAAIAPKVDAFEAILDELGLPAQ